MQDIILQKKLVFSNDDKKQCLPTAQQIIKLAKEARQNGVLNLDTKAHQCTFLTKGLELVVNGRPPEMVERTFRVMILTENQPNAEYLRRLIIAEGILAIQMGVNLKEIANTLGEMLGEEYAQEILNC
ncbi:MAG: hypothetical protein FWC89_03305 [Defluviitaleaceae bacterium]|nr:hypothetical protein [Defluviitaleaceae bacterium]